MIEGEDKQELMDRQLEMDKVGGCAGDGVQESLYVRGACLSSGARSHTHKLSCFVPAANLCHSTHTPYGRREKRTLRASLHGPRSSAVEIDGWLCGRALQSAPVFVCLFCRALQVVERDMARKRVNGLMGAADSDTAGQDSGKKGVIEALKILLPSSDVEMDKKVWR